MNTPREKLHSSGRKKLDSVPRRNQAPKLSILDILDTAARMRLHSIEQLTGCEPHEAPDIKREFCRFVQKHQPQHKEWKTEYDAWLEFRLQEKREERAAHAAWDQAMGINTTYPAGLQDGEEITNASGRVFKFQAKYSTPAVGYPELNRGQVTNALSSTIQGDMVNIPLPPLVAGTQLGNLCFKRVHR